MLMQSQSELLMYSNSSRETVLILKSYGLGIGGQGPCSVLYYTLACLYWRYSRVRRVASPQSKPERCMMGGQTQLLSESKCAL